MNDDTTDKQTIYLCDCYAHGVVLSHGDGDIELGFWHYGHVMSTDRKTKRRHIKRIREVGYPYTDMVILRSGTARALAEALLAAADKEEAHDQPD